MSELCQVLTVTRALYRFFDAWVRPDATDGRHNKGQCMYLQRTEGYLYHDLAAILTLGRQLHMRTHGARDRRMTIGFPVGRMARTVRVGHQRVHAHADQFPHRVAEQPGGHRVGQRNGALVVDEQQCVRVGREYRAKDRFFIYTEGNGWNDRHGIRGERHDKALSTGGTRI